MMAGQSENWRIWLRLKASHLDQRSPPADQVHGKIGDLLLQPGRSNGDDTLASLFEVWKPRPGHRQPGENVQPQGDGLD
jgi:hypothetical protein